MKRSAIRVPSHDYWNYRLRGSMQATLAGAVHMPYRERWLCSNGLSADKHDALVV
jgi:hypothetical protein